MTHSTDDLIAELCTYLRTLRMTAEYRLDEYGDPIRPGGEYTSEWSPAWDIAREWAYALLTAADVNGSGECPLCGS